MHMTVDEQVGERVHQAMWRQRLQQSEVAPALGITQSTLSRKIRGQRTWSVEDLLRVAGALNVDPSDLLPDVPGAPAVTSLDVAADMVCCPLPTMRDYEHHALAA